MKALREDRFDNARADLGWPDHHAGKNRLRLGRPKRLDDARQMSRHRQGHCPRRGEGE